MSRNKQSKGEAQQRYRPRSGRVAVVLLLSFAFCVSALIASGTFDSSTDPSRSSTRILTPEEAVQQAEQGTLDERDGSAPIALVALLLLTSGALLLSLAIPTPAERKRHAAAAAYVPVPPPAAVPVGPPQPRRQRPETQSVRMAVPPVRVNPDIEETRVLAPMPGLRRVGAVRPTRPAGNLPTEQVSACTCCPVHTRTVARYAQVK